jgi:hypothetical protein
MRSGCAAMGWWIHLRCAQARSALNLTQSQRRTRRRRRITIRRPIGSRC